jgi:DHA1 family bicyclomycin/chloramphenicol resistance-like MFS transporter
MMMATAAFSVDAMLPAMGLIATDLSLSDPQHAPLIVVVFMVGMGIGSMISGPLSDAIGRRPVFFVGFFIYAVSAIMSYFASSLELMLFARLLQGFGAAGPRVVATVIVRDQYKGREMARIMSLGLMVFLLMPAVAPMLGDLLSKLAGWRSIFLTFVVFAVVMSVWFGLRHPETLAPEARRPFRFALMLDAIQQMFQNPTVRAAIFVQTLLMAMLFSILAMVEPIFRITFERGDTFAYWIGAIALASSVSSFLNAQLVLRFGMRRLISFALHMQVILTSLAILSVFADMPGAFAIYVIWQFGVFLQAGLTTANLNAIATEPMGHIAGMASSVMGGLTVVFGATLGGIFAQLFDGTQLPLYMVVLGLMVCSIILIHAIRRHELRTA